MRCKAIESLRHDLGELGGRRQTRELGGIAPARLIELLVEENLARAPARGKAQDDEMPLDPAVRVAHDGFAKAGERDRLDRHPGLLAHLAHHRFLERLSHLDYASGQAVEAMRRRACAG